MKVDYSALTRAVSRDELRDYAKRSRTHLGGVGPIVSVVAAAVIGVIVISMAMGEVGPGSLSMLTFAVIVVIAIAAFTWLSTAIALRKSFRMHTFAEANGLQYTGRGSGTDYPGAIFGIGSARTITERLYRTQGGYFDLGSYRYTTGSGKNKRTHNWGYLAIKLPRRLPHMLLDAKANNFFGSNLPVSFGRNQRLSLEGNFDDHFTLYCPREYERDALYVFTPDLMALLIEESGEFDLEIVDDWLFVYTSGPLELTSPSLLSRLFRIVDTVGAKTLSRTVRYADDRVVGDPLASGTPGEARLAPNVIAQGGRRLKRGVPVVGLIIFAGVALYLMARFVSAGFFL